MTNDERDVNPGTGSAESPAGAGSVDPLDLTIPVELIEQSAPSADTAGSPTAPETGDADGEDDSDEPRSASTDSTEDSAEGAGDDTSSSVVQDDEPGVQAAESAVAAGGAAAGGWRRLGRAMRPRATRAQLLAGVLCAALGFALVVQLQLSSADPLSSARQDDLIRLLDDVTQRSERLDEEIAGLEATRDELRSGSGQAQAARELAEQRAETEGILSGRLPAVGPGLEIVIRDPDGGLDAAKMFNILEELRNAGAEVVELDGVRLVTSTWFLDSVDGIVVDEVLLSPPYTWTVIGDPATMNPALEIPGGALATLRAAGASPTTTEHDELEVNAVRVPGEPEHATPQRPEE